MARRLPVISHSGWATVKLGIDHAAVHLAETTIAALAGSDEAHERRRELRDQTILAVADVRRNIIVRAEQAKEEAK
jgi:hypothetical protein